MGQVHENTNGAFSIRKLPKRSISSPISTARRIKSIHSKRSPSFLTWAKTFFSFGFILENCYLVLVEIDTNACTPQRKTKES